MFEELLFAKVDFWLEPGKKSRGSMGRVPALGAESVFYWIRQEKRKRRDAIAKLEAKMIYFYTEAKMTVKDNDNVDLPPLQINDISKDEEKEDKQVVADGNYTDDELMH